VSGPRKHPFGCTCRTHVARPWNRAEHWTRAEVEELEAAWVRTGLRGGPTSIDTAREALALGVELGRADRTGTSPAELGQHNAELASANGSTNIPENIPDEPADDAPEVVTRPPGAAAQMADFAAERAARAAGGGPGRGPGRLSRQQERVLEATIKHGGDRRAVVAELGLTVKNVEQVLAYIGKKGLLPVELIPKLPARFAKYTPAVG
jgi:hypothetical protein